MRVFCEIVPILLHWLTLFKMLCINKHWITLFKILGIAKI